jgi:hypothetical protein
MSAAKPQGYENYLSDYKPCLFDGWCGETIGWGFEVTAEIPRQLFEILPRFGSVETSSGTWFLITKWLSREKAEKRFGPVSNEEYGPRGGWKSVTFGTTKFISQHLKA